MQVHMKSRWNAYGRQYGINMKSIWNVNQESLSGVSIWSLNLDRSQSGVSIWKLIIWHLIIWNLNLECHYLESHSGISIWSPSGISIWSLSDLAALER